MQSRDQIACPPLRQAETPCAGDEIRSILADTGIWPGLSVAAVIDRFETEPRTSR